MDDQRVVFVRGTGRCGSKNLVTHLGHHPQLAHIPVNQTLPEELIDWSRQHLQTGQPVQAGNAKITDQTIAASCRAYFEAYGRAVADGQGILLQKSTRHAHHLGTLLEFWPLAKIVYLVRHPFGVVEALINAAAHDRADGQPDYGYRAGVADSLLQWSTEICEYLDSPAFGHPRLFQIHFERLIADPVGTVRELLRFLELEETTLPPFGEPELYNDPFVLNEPERRWIIEQTSPALARLGYDPQAWSAEVPTELVRHLDHWPQCRLRGRPASINIARLTALAIEQLAVKGWRRVGLFGAGYAARRACTRLGELPAELICIFDENPSLHGTHIAGYPVVSPERASEMRVEAVVAMTFVHQQQLMDRWRKLCGQAIPILPLWDDQDQGAADHPAALAGS